MIQRIQNLFFLLSALLLASAVFLPVGYFSTADLVEEDVFRPWGVYFSDGSFHSTWALALMLACAAVSVLAALMQILDQKRQVRLAVFSALLIVGFLISLTVFSRIIGASLPGESFRPSWCLSIPVAALVLDLLALRAVLLDRVVSRAAGKLR